MIKKIVASLLMTLSCQTFSQVQEFTLNNGLKVLVKEDHRAPIAVSMIWYKVGSADEPGGITGVSHAIEHMMFKGTSKHPLGTFSKIIATQGGQENAFTNQDYTAYFEKIAASQLATSLELEADRMNHLILDAKEFSKEIKVIEEERRLRTDDNPQALAFERFLATAHLTSPYKHPVIGWMSDLKQMKVEDLQKWYQLHYAPNNATLVVVGDVKPEEIHQLAERYFGSIAKKPIETPKPQQEPKSLGKKTVTVHAPAKLPLLVQGYTVPTVATAKTPWEPYALEIITGILDGGESARFTKNLIRGNYIAADAEVQYNLYAKYPTQFIMYGIPNQNHQMNSLQRALGKEIKELQATLISPSELQRIKTQIIAQKTFEKDSIYGQAMELGLLETVGIGWRHTNQYIQEINAITPEQIQQTAQKYFQEDNMTEAKLIPLGNKEVHS